MFKLIVPTCKVCKEVAVGALNCSLCAKSLLCQVCVSGGVTACKKCRKKNGDSPYPKSTVNVVADSILQASKFRCPYPQCQVSNIAYADLEKHMREECEFKQQFCHLKCGAKLLPKDIASHFDNDCVRQPVTCTQCGTAKTDGSTLRRGLLEDHLQKCSKFTVCPDCNGSYKKGHLLTGKDYDHRCSEFLTRLIKEVAGKEAYDQALDNLTPGSDNKMKDQGTLNLIIGDKLTNAIAEIERLIQKMEQERDEKDVLLDVRLQEIESFWTDQQTTNKYLKPFVVAEQTFAKVRKIELVGAAECHQSF